MKYTALTVGPIIDSLNKAHKTREIWATSYLFSHLMEMIIGNLIENGIDEDKFVLPYPKARKFDLDNQFKKAGIFPDRLILKSDDGLFDKLDKALEDAIKEVVKYFKAANKKDTSDYLSKYLRTNIIETELPEKTNVIFEINKLLANTELQSRLIAEDQMYFENFMGNINATKLFTDVFGKDYSYPSIFEIAIRKIDNGNNLTATKINELKEAGKKILNKKNPDKDYDDDEMLVTGLENDDELKNMFKTAHKYIAIVQADGDNVGKLIKLIYKTNSSLITEFSKSFSQFSLEAVKVITKYGGEPVYAGGDDLLFFAPVITNDENIFNLLDNIDKKFNENILENVKLNECLKQLTETKDECGQKLKLPSMSYGLSVTYYKYPMHEALNSARKLLFEKAKSGDKNAIAYILQKHSGQSFEDVILKESKFYKLFRNMLNNKDENLISSLLYNLENQRFILKEIADREDRLDNFFDNFYDEDIHKEKGNKDFIDKLKKMIFITHSETGGNINKTLQKVYSALRFVKFINRKNNE